MPPGVGFWLVFIGLGGGTFELFFCPGVGNSPIKRLPRGFALGEGGGWSGLELTDTLHRRG